ncbi:MAG: hypothetical protein RL468_346 [Pseudomonadota bacterium]
MHVIVTRPQQDALAWARELMEAGHLTTVLPLIQIASASDTQPLLKAWHQLDQYRGVMFVSRHAVEGFFAVRPSAAPGFSASTHAWATGPGTQAALLRAGVASPWIDSPETGQFDSEALWATMRTQVDTGCRVLIVRGGDSQLSSQPQGLGRDWFAEQVQKVGGQTEFVVAYQRQIPRWNEGQRALAKAAASNGSIWLFSSSEAVANLGACLAGQGWGQACAIATHARVALAARHAGFGSVRESRPVLADILASIESFQ